MDSAGKCSWYLHSTVSSAQRPQGRVPLHLTFRALHVSLRIINTWPSGMGNNKLSPSYACISLSFPDLALPLFLAI